MIKFESVYALTLENLSKKDSKFTAIISPVTIG